MAAVANNICCIVLIFSKYVHIPWDSNHCITHLTAQVQSKSQVMVAVPPEPTCQ